MGRGLDELVGDPQGKTFLLDFFREYPLLSIGSMRGGQEPPARGDLSKFARGRFISRGS